MHCMQGSGGWPWTIMSIDFGEAGFLHMARTLRQTENKLTALSTPASAVQLARKMKMLRTISVSVAYLSTVCRWFVPRLCCATVAR